MSTPIRVAGINFAHMHMGDNLRMAFDHPDVEIAGVCDADPARMADAVRNFSIPADRVFTDWAACMESAQPDLVILCPPTAEHGDWVERVAPCGAQLLVEKPFAGSLAEADRMIAACAPGQRLAINWPLAWYPAHVTAGRLLREGRIGELCEVHYYDGNRGPLWHLADKEETKAEYVAREMPESWFYRRASGGGSLQDYLGYGATLGTWFYEGEKPIEVTCTVDQPVGLEVDEHSITVARYARGLSKFETRWGTFTNPWTHQPQPKCGFVLAGTAGTISSYDFEPTVRVQDAAHPEGAEVPVDTLQSPFQNPVQYMVHCMQNDLPIEGSLSPEISRIGQQIVDTAMLSAEEKRTVALIR